MNFTLTEEKLKEKIKEFTCLYETSKIISQSNCFEKRTLKKIIINTKKAWRFNEDAIVEIHTENDTLSTSKIAKSTVFQMSLIYVNKINYGFIKVHYPQENHSQNSFLEDEQKLLDTIALKIGNYIDKFQTLEKKELLRRSAERKDRLSILGELTVGIAHDLNTPLSNMLGYANLIKDRNKDEEIDEDISTIIDSILYSREVIKKLMLFSSELPHQLEIKEIKPIVNFVQTSLNQKLRKKEIKNEIIFKTENITAKVDSVQITQLLFNLLINAIYASPEKSSIKTILESDSKNVIITIEDQGTGIPKNIKEKIFEPFFTTKSKTDGSGLGLSVVEGIVKKHKGKITVKDNIPQGTIFSIKLPVR